MPRFFDDYSNTYLTHDSAAGRKQQRRGWKFRENFKLHYQKHLEEWQRGPMGLASAQQAFLRNTAHNPAAASMVPPLPEGWEEHTDGATRITYYVHEQEGKRQWHRPGFIPPPAGGGGGGGNMRGGGPPPLGGGGGGGGGLLSPYASVVEQFVDDVTAKTVPEGGGIPSTTSTGSGTTKGMTNSLVKFDQRDVVHSRM
eukprot:CAMPEP_0195307334 /NCGR_PEP_ID=MMETSP0707-20130614/37664_1 /TAXON_ID=33640 /ORGANISM="Asterionellopsis glacialis, Strain CCMP134" /LENGTH=197 /DNA_ID=CAMNT_0040371583 /DNA_START=1090 /DNA_END=1685 /DNA_ORIENTATION=-